MLAAENTDTASAGASSASGTCSHDSGDEGSASDHKIPSGGFRPHDSSREPPRGQSGNDQELAGTQQREPLVGRGRLEQVDGPRHDAGLVGEPGLGQVGLVSGLDRGDDPLLGAVVEANGLHSLGRYAGHAECEDRALQGRSESDALCQAGQGTGTSRHQDIVDRSIEERLTLELVHHADTVPSQGRPGQLHGHGVDGLYLEAHPGSLSHGKLTKELSPLTPRSSEQHFAAETIDSGRPSQLLNDAAGLALRSARARNQFGARRRGGRGLVDRVGRARIIGPRALGLLLRIPEVEPQLLRHGAN
jgi:hypothetical protein